MPSLAAPSADPVGFDQPDPPAAQTPLRSRRLRPSRAVLVVLAILLLAELWARAVGPHLPPSVVGDAPEMSLKLGRMQHLGETDVVVLGNSMTDHGLDPAVIRRVDPGVGSIYNASLAGAPAVGTERWATKYVVPNLHPKTALIGVNPLTLLTINPVDALTGGQSDGSAVQVIENAFLDSLDRLDPGPLDRLGQRAADYSALVRYRTTLRNPADAWRGTVDAIRGRPKPVGLQRIAEEGPDHIIVARDRAFWKRHLMADGFADQIGTRAAENVLDPRAVAVFRSTVNGSSPSISEFRSLVSRVARSVDRVVVVVMPLAPGFVAALGKKAVATLNEASHELDKMVGDLGVEKIDLTTTPLEPRHFADPLHLNIPGAAIVSRRLAEQIG